jgi:hypothetical protein
MNLKHREKIINLIVRLYGMRVNLSVFVLEFWTKLTDLRADSLERDTRKLQDITRSLNSLTNRMQCLTTEFKALNDGGLTNKALTRAHLMAKKEELLAEGKYLDRAASKLRRPSWANAAVFDYAQVSIDESIVRSKKSMDSLFRIISRIESPTFYWDLMLWLLTPGLYSEEMLGDLNEEYLLRASADGKRNANAWYQHQAIATIARYCWKRAERMATIATLIDLVERWLKK